MSNLDTYKENKRPSRSCTLPVKLDKEMMGMINEFGYGGPSEFIRESVRMNVSRLKSTMRDAQIWKKLSEETKAELEIQMDEKTSELEEGMKVLQSGTEDANEQFTEAELDELKEDDEEDTKTKDDIWT